MLRQCRAFNQGAGADFTSKFAKVGSELTPKGASSQSSEASKQLTSELAGGRTMKINYNNRKIPFNRDRVLLHSFKLSLLTPHSFNLKPLGLEFKLKNDLKSATAWIPVEGLKALSTTVLSVAGMLARPPPPHPPPPKCIHGYRHRLVTRRTHINHRLGRRLGHRWAIAAARGTA